MRFYWTVKHTVIDEFERKVKCGKKPAIGWNWIANYLTMQHFSESRWLGASLVRGNKKKWWFIVLLT